MVHFDNANQITQIRVSWDQACLLKQVGVIGSRGNNWPVVDGKEQIRLISHSSTAAVAERASSPRGRSPQEEDFPARDHSPSKKHIKDPYASLDLFSPKTSDENRGGAPSNPIAPRASARPPPREMSELFVAGHEDYEPSPANGGSPKKTVTTTAVAPKGAGSKKFMPSRLFEDDSDAKTAVGYKSNPAKYDHFDIGDEMEGDPLQYKGKVGAESKEAIPIRPRSNKHLSQWNFQDFTTPQKLPQKVRGQDVVHFSWEEEAEPSVDSPGKRAGASKPRRDADTHFELQDDGTPIERHVVPQPRKDAETHFELRDEATPTGTRVANRPAPGGRDYQSLYKNNLYEEDFEDHGTGSEKAPLATITNNAGRKHDFSSHWTMSGSSPATEKTNNENKPVGGGGGDHLKVVQSLDAHWGSYGQSPEQVKKPATNTQLRKGLESHWRFEDEEPVSMTGGSREKAEKSFWDF